MYFRFESIEENVYFILIADSYCQVGGGLKEQRSINTEGRAVVQRSSGNTRFAESQNAFQPVCLTQYTLP